MPFREPNPPSGSGPLQAWCRRVWGTLRALRVLPGRGYRVKYTSQGVMLEMDVPQSRNQGGRPAMLRCKIISLSSSNYMQVCQWDGANYVGGNFYAAKSVPSRMPSSATRYGVGYTYTYTDSNTRTSITSGLANETQVMFEEFNIGDEITVGNVGSTGVTVSGNDLEWIEINTAREWTKLWTA